jgi:hypothetical protein
MYLICMLGGLVCCVGVVWDVVGLCCKCCSVDGV